MWWWTPKMGVGYLVGFFFSAPVFPLGGWDDGGTKKNNTTHTPTSRKPPPWVSVRFLRRWDEKSREVGQKMLRQKTNNQKVRLHKHFLHTQTPSLFLPHDRQLQVKRCSVRLVAFQDVASVEEIVSGHPRHVLWYAAVQLYERLLHL